jgi:hypothetical protein
MHLKKLFPDKDIRLYMGPLYKDENLYPGITFLGAFVTKVSFNFFYFWYLR